MDEKQVTELLDKKTPFSDDIKRQIKRSRKPTGRTVSHYLCDSCDTEIIKPEDGFIIHGNIYVADPKCCGGLIGNNFPDKKTFSVDEIQQIVLCKMCFCKSVGLFDKSKQGTEAVSASSRINPGIPVSAPNSLYDAVRAAAGTPRNENWRGWESPNLVPETRSDPAPDLTPDLDLGEDIPF